MKFYVRGRGEFPFDMLRYDAAYPTGPGDASGMYGGWDTKTRTVQLETNRNTFTPARWASFGWAANEEDIWGED